MNAIFNLVFISLTALFLFELAVSLGWRMMHDTPLLHYVAFLIDKFDYVPYKDIFETSLPGTLLFHLLIGKLFGYGDLAFRITDIVLLCTLSGFTWGIMRPFGRWAAFASIPLFGLSYLNQGASMSLQRDYVGILPIAGALCLAVASTAMNGGRSCKLKAPIPGPESRGCLTTYSLPLLIGLLFGLSATIKPHLSIGLPLVILYIYQSRKSKIGTQNSKLSLLICTSVGFALPVSVSLLWLWKQGALPCFLEMFLSYLPLHLHLTGTCQIIGGTDHLFYLVKSYIRFGGFSFWLIPAFAGCYILFFKAECSPEQMRLGKVLAGLTLLYSIYPVFAGQFWPYHWMPFQYFIVLISSFLFIPLPAINRPLFALRRPWTPTFINAYLHRLSPDAPRQATDNGHLHPLVVLFFSILLAYHVAPDVIRQIKTGDVNVLQYGHDRKIAEVLKQRMRNVEEISAFLKSYAKAKEKVQPLDWTSGAVHAMLLAQVPVATPYIYDYHFYHHISNPYIQTLRKRFMTQLRKENPRFIIHIPGRRVSGEDTTKDFPQLQEFVKEKYRPALTEKRFIIYENKRIP